MMMFGETLKAVLEPREFTDRNGNQKSSHQVQLEAKRRDGSFYFISVEIDPEWRSHVEGLVGKPVQFTVDVFAFLTKGGKAFLRYVARSRPEAVQARAAANAA